MKSSKCQQLNLAKVGISTSLMVVSDKRKGGRESMHKKFSILATRKNESITTSRLNITMGWENALCLVTNHVTPEKKSTEL